MRLAAYSRRGSEFGHSAFQTALTMGRVPSVSFDKPITLDSLAFFSSATVGINPSGHFLCL